MVITGDFNCYYAKITHFLLPSSALHGKRRCKPLMVSWHHLRLLKFLKYLQKIIQSRMNLKFW